MGCGGVGVWGCGEEYVVCSVWVWGGVCTYDLNTHQVSLEEKSKEGIQPKEPSKPCASLFLPARDSYLNS